MIAQAEQPRQGYTRVGIRLSGDLGGLGSVGSSWLVGSCRALTATWHGPILSGLPTGGVAKVVIAPACQAGGRGFKSRRSRPAIWLSVRQRSTGCGAVASALGSGPRGREFKSPQPDTLLYCGSEPRGLVRGSPPADRCGVWSRVVWYVGARRRIWWSVGARGVWSRVVWYGSPPADRCGVWCVGARRRFVGGSVRRSRVWRCPGRLPGPTRRGGTIPAFGSASSLPYLQFPQC